MATTDPTTQLATVPFGTRDEVKELQERLVIMLPSILPNASALSQDEARALSQVALAHGLSPFNSEIYFIPRLGVYPGIRGYRKAARRQVRRDGGQYWLSEPKWCEATGYGGEAGDLCCVYELRDSVTMGRYLDLRAKIFDMNRLPSDIMKLANAESLGLLKDAIERTSLQILGNPPITVGVGIVKKFEIENRLKKAGLNPSHIAKIRAERAALRLRFDLDLVFGNNDDAWQEAEAIDAQAEDVEEPHIESNKSPMEQLGFKDEKPIYHTPAVIEWKPAQIKALIETGADGEFAAKGRLGLSCLPADATIEQVKAWGVLYAEKRGNPKDKENKITSAEAAAYANEKYQESK